MGWTTRGTLIAFAVWLVFVATGIVLWATGRSYAAVVAVLVGFFVAPFIMVIAGRSR